MPMILFISIITIVGLYLYFHSKGNKKSHKSSERYNRKNKRHAKITSKPAKNDEFHCVEAHHDALACDAVKDLHGKRFLSAQAPTLPVKGCNKAQCNCDYIHHDDRRTEMRRSIIGIQYAMYGQNGEVDHRTGLSRGRRKNEI